MPETITSGSNRKWLSDHRLKVLRYLRRNHRREDHETIFDLMYWQYPDEGRKLVENFDLSNSEKLSLFYDFVLKSPQLTMLIVGDQRQGKDATICKIFQDILDLNKENLPRIVTLGNIRLPPFVQEGDQYFSFLNIPSGSLKNEVWVYSSEIETLLPAREGTSPENRLFAQLEGTMAQNHQKLFGCVKLASKVDINAIRSSNVKVFKFISRDKLSIDGVERDKFLSGLGRWLLPRDPLDKSQALLVFNNYLLTVSLDLPSWWNQDYSEQYKEIPMDKVYEYIETVSSNGLDPSSIRIAVAQKFRKKLTKEQIVDYIGRKS